MSIFGSTKLDDDRAAAPAVPAPSESAFSRGLRSGGLSAKGQLHSLAGGLRGAFGDDEGAARSYAEAQRLEGVAQEGAPNMDFREALKGPRQGWDYVTGALGSSIPQSAAALAGAVLTRGRGTGLVQGLRAGAGSTAALAPFETGEAVQRQQAADPNKPVDMTNAALSGLGSAAVQSIVPSAVAGKLAGSGMRAGTSTLRRKVGENLLDIPMEAATEAAGAKVHQYGASQFAPDRDTSGDVEELKQAAAGGAAGGIGFAGVGAVADVAHGGIRRKTPGATPPGASGEAPGETRGPSGTPLEPGGAENASEAGIPLPESPSVAERAKRATADLFSRAKRTVDPSMDAILKGSEEVVPRAGESVESLMDRLREADAGRVEKVRAWGQSILDDAMISPERRERVRQAMTDLGDAANQTIVAAEAKAQEGVRAARAKIDELLHWKRTRRTKSGEGLALDDGKTIDGDDLFTRRSEISEGFRRVITDEVLPVIEERNAGFMDDPSNVNALATLMRRVFAQTTDGQQIDRKTLEGLRELLGDGQTATVLQRLYDSAGESGDRDADARFYHSLNRLIEDETERSRLEGFLSQNLVESLQDTTTTTDIREALNNMEAFLSRDTSKQPAEKTAFEEAQFRAQVQQAFGEKTDAVLDQIARLQDRVKTVDDTLEDTNYEDAYEGYTKDGRDTLTEGDANLRFYGAGKNQGRAIDGKRVLKMMPSPEAHRAEHGNEGQAERMIRELKEKHPDRKVRFVPAREYASLTMTEYDPANEGKGVIVVEGAVPEKEQLNDSDLAAMKADARYKNSESRIDVGDDITLDALRIVKVMGNKLDYNASDEKSAMHRNARVFMAGVAAAQEALGRTFTVGDDTVVYYSNGQPIRWKALKKLKFGLGERSTGTADRLANEDRGEIKLFQTIERLTEKKAASPAQPVVAIKEPPATYKSFAGVGTRELNSEGAAAIRDYIARIAPGAMIHSGGAKGADTVFGRVGNKAGHTVLAHSFEGHNPAMGSGEVVRHSAEDLAQADAALNRVNRDYLQRTYPTKNPFVNNLLRRNYFQVKDSEALIAAAPIKDGVVQGGTAWAVYMALDMGKPAYVFDTTTGQWTEVKGVPFSQADEAELAFAERELQQRKLEEHKDEAGKREVGPDDEIHLSEAGADGDLARTVDASGFNLRAEKSRSRKDAFAAYTDKEGKKRQRLTQAGRKLFDERVKRYENSTSAKHRELGKKLRMVVDNIDMLPVGAQQRLNTAIGWHPDRSRPSGYAMNLGGKEQAEAIMDAYEHIQELRTPDDFGGEAAVAPARAKGASPASKKAQLTQRARSGDPKLIKQVNESNDVRGLQRAAEHLNGWLENQEKLDPEEVERIAHVIDTMNRRMQTLVDSDPEVAYGMATKRYSLVSADDSQHAPVSTSERYVSGVLNLFAPFVKSLGFKVAPPHFAEVAGKLLTDPGISPTAFMRDVATGLSHLLLEGERGRTIKGALQSDYWFSVRAKMAAQLSAREPHLGRGELLAETYRKLTERALRGEFKKRIEEERSFVTKVVNLAKDFMDSFRTLTASEEFSRVVRKELNAMVEERSDAIDKEFVKLDFQRAVDADPTAAQVLATIGTNKDATLTGSIVLSLHGSIYRRKGNPLHDLDFVYAGEAEAAERFLLEHYPQAASIYDFNARGVRIRSFLVPPAGAEIRNIKREGMKLVGSEIVRDGKTIGRTWYEGDIERKEGETGVLVDFFTGVGTIGRTSSVANFTVGGKSHQIGITSAASIFESKLQMGREKDLIDYRRFVPSVGSTRYSLVSTVVHEKLGKTGIPAAHDSPHRFDGRFDWRARAGTGEGQMTYGDGSYLSTTDEAHKFYKGAFTAMIVDSSHVEQAASLLEKTWEELGWVTKDIEVLRSGGRSSEVATSEIRGLEVKAQQLESRIAQYEQQLKEERAKLTKADKFKGDVSPTYHVTIDATPEEIFDWNEPLTEQNPMVRAALRTAIKEHGIEITDGWDGLRADMEYWRRTEDGEGFAFGPYELRAAHDGHYTLENDDSGDFLLLPATSPAKAIEAAMRRASSSNPSGEELYRAVARALNGTREASEYLQSLGLVGHTYVSSSGSRNYVIFDDSRIETNWVQFSRQRAASQPMSAADRKAVKDYIDKTLGPLVEARMANIPHAGEFIERVGAPDLIRISAHALDPTSVAYHESLHAFFKQLRKGGQRSVIDTLVEASSKGHVMKQLNALLKDEPAALKQLADPEERAAYTYQFYMSGDLTLNHKGARGVIEQIANFFRELVGVWSNEQQALRVFEYFSSGEYVKNIGDRSAVVHAMEGRQSDVVRQARALHKSFRNLSDSVLAMGGNRLRDTGVPALSELADRIKRLSTQAGDDAGFLPASRLARTEWMNKLGRLVKDYSPEEMREALDALQKGNYRTAPAGKPRMVARSVNQMLRDLRKYMVEAGVEMGDLGENYFPRVWDTGYISKHQAEFRQMMTKYVQAGDFKGDVDELIRTLMTNDIVELRIETDRPGMVFAKKRRLDFISADDAAPFMRKDLLSVLDSYITQAARRAEWARRFDDSGKALTALYERAKKEGASQRELDQAETYLKGINGTLGDTIDPTTRRMMGNMIVYQNIRLLPLAMFSSLVDPMGIMVRGGTIQDSWKAFKRGISEIPSGFKKDPVRDQSYEVAELMGTIDNAVLTATLGQLYSQGMVGGKAQKLNDAFFKYNMMEQFNRSMRVSATEAALSFLARHADGKADEHSTRWLRELGLEPGEVLVVDGRPAMTAQEFEQLGLSKTEAIQREAKIRAAVNMWVDGAVLRPDAADRPVWFNDPRFALISHLKQWTYGFHQTILKRVAHEYQQGNYVPAMALSTYVPIMIAADAVKAMLQGGGEIPDWKKHWTASDYVWSGVQRGGLLGVGQVGADLRLDLTRGGSGLGAVAGPTIEQLADAVQLAAGRKQFGPFVLNSMPANGVYKHWKGGDSVGGERIRDR